TGGRADLIWDAVALHDQGGIARWKQPEVMLVNAGVNTDFGANLDILDRSDVIAVLKAAPRDRFVPVFLNVVAAYVKRKPFATGNSWITDVGYRMVPGFHLDNFVDEVQADPFAGYR
ncbi:MAG: phosphohydrolase, partial [Candidatus Eremiobacteraeota bacterium]|nr:phosphohydrolase [Candidatus Eremiobacteraeota bacterium]